MTTTKTEGEVMGTYLKANGVAELLGVQNSTIYH